MSGEKITAALITLVVLAILWAVAIGVAASRASDLFVRYNESVLLPLSKYTERVLPQVMAPNGTLVTPFLVGSDKGGIGPPRVSLPVVEAGDIATFSLFYRYLSGPDPIAAVCLNGSVSGYDRHQCLEFDASEGVFRRADPGILTYTVASIGSDGWRYVSITCRITADGVAFPYTQTHALQRYATWRWRFITGREPTPYSGPPDSEPELRWFGGGDMGLEPEKERP